MNIKTVFSNPKLLTLNGITLEVFEAGQQNNNPIVLCHGWPQHAYSWRHQISALVEEGYHVIIPNQRGYGQSSSPSEVTSYDIKHLTGDLIALLDYYNYNDAIFIGHDWGAMIVWSLSLLYPDRVKKIINLSVPYQERGDQPWIEFLESLMGTDNYFVHFNRHPGVADTIFNENTFQFLRNLYRKDVPTQSPKPGMALINLARETTPYGEPLMNDYDLSVFVNAFQKQDSQEVSIGTETLIEIGISLKMLILLFIIQH